MQPNHCQTPDASRSRSNPSWVADLDAYIASHEGTPGGDRHTLVSNVKLNPQSAEAWRSLMAYEESHSANNTYGLHAATAVDNNKVSLYHVYYWATQLVPRSKNQHKEAYLQLWLGFARQQWVRSQDDARDTFKTLKNQLVGDGSAFLYHEWASLEHAAGNVSKALGILAKGLRSDAQPSSILEHLRVEMQSGTFDLKSAGSYTETLTIDASSAAARQLQQSAATPAPPAASVLKAVSGGCQGGRPTAGGCLKGSNAAQAVCPPGHLPEHAGRAVTFAADVRGDICGSDEPGRRPGSSSANSIRSVTTTADAHSGWLSTSSTSSRSTTSVHDGTLPFSTGAVSYKSSTTESSSMGGLEEDTISCQAAGAATGPAGKDASSKPSTAPLSGHPAQGAGASASNTATLGLKRFGFKSRALRVGSAADGPARMPQPAADSITAKYVASRAAMPPQPAEPAACTVTSPAANTWAAAQTVKNGDLAVTAAANKKRRAGEASSPNEKMSPKLNTAHDGRHECQRLLNREEPVGLLATMCETAEVAHKPAAAVAAVADDGSSNVVALRASNMSEEESVPLVTSKLAARLAQDRGTPLVAGRPHDPVEGWLGMGDSTPPADGQLPSSLDNTPEPVEHQRSASATAHAPPGSFKPAGGTSHGRHQHTQKPTANVAAAPSSQLPRDLAASRHNQTGSNMAAAADAEALEQPLPTIILPGVPALPLVSSRQPSSTRDNIQREAVHQLRDDAATTREPLRQLQSQQVFCGPCDPKGQSGQSTLKQGGVASAERLDSDSQQQHQEQPPRHPLPGTQQQVPRQQQIQLMGPPPPGALQQQQTVRQSRPREDAQTVFVQGIRYTKLECVGRGGSSKVFKVMGPSCKIYALKRIRLAGRDAEAASGFIDEINLLLRLKNKPNIIQLVESQVFQEEGLIYMVQEYGEIDLARLLAKHDAVRRAAAGSSAGNAALLPDNLDENFIRLYWQQMLQAVAGVHEQRIVHSDLKPANFLLVEGQLKLIDFGIAKAINGDTTSIARESQVGTLNYMSPEAILGGSNNILGGPAMKVGRPSDVWSLGCILYQMVFGRTPFANLPFLPKMHAICNPQHQVTYPPLANADLLDVMKRCLDRDPKTRITLQELLDHPFLHPNRERRQPPAQAPPTGLSEEQMKLLVAQVAAAGAAGVTDIDKLTRDLMQKLGTAAHPTA